jgi:hypothetical protein
VTLDTRTRELESWWRGFYKRFYYKHSNLLDHVLDFTQHRIVRVCFPKQLL